MAEQLIISVNKASASFSTRQRVVLGSSYYISIDDVAGAQLVLVDCCGNPVAMSDDSGLISINTQAAINAFPKGCNTGTASTFYGYLVKDGSTIAGGTIPVLFSPISFSEVGAPVTLKGEQGIPGPPGKSAFAQWLEYNPNGSWQGFLESIRGQKGEDGRNAAVLETNGLFSFQVQDENLYVFAQGEDALYARDAEGKIDYTKPLYHINSTGDLLYDFYYFSEGESHPVIKTLNLGRVKGNKGDPGEDGLSQEEIEEIIESVLGSVVKYANTETPQTAIPLKDSVTGETIYVISKNKVLSIAEEV